MPPGKTAKAAMQAVAAGSGGIESLPDSVLEHILGFLPSPEAVRTCVLARRWRHLWKSATGMWVGHCDPNKLVSVEDLRNFMNHLLLLRGGATLDRCYLTFYDRRSSQDDVPHVNLWFRHLVKCKVRVLSLFLFGRSSGEPWLELHNLPLISQHLARLELQGVQVHDSLLNFSSCPALEHLELHECELSSVKKIVSESLKHLSIKFSFSPFNARICICTPNLVWLRLAHLERTPLLERMPSLLKAIIKITMICKDRCTDANYETCDCEYCDSSDSMANGNKNSVLLKGLSEAQSLALISASVMFICKRDLRWCPMFTKLKTLLLNDYWCVLDDFRALACILEHSPVLEKLTLQLGEKYLKHVEMKFRIIPIKRSAAISEHLTIVQFDCEKVNDRVLKVMKFLREFTICKQTCNAPHAFIFLTLL
ncbi:unnamed protein product [Urochloa decumbens]|uniref:F-box domain-containing protein n=1 Tax=Urochloa decumbens TaxID=240449 RepID=A0ABC9B843_9POAL